MNGKTELILTNPNRMENIKPNNDFTFLIIFVKQIYAEFILVMNWKSEIIGSISSILLKFFRIH